MPIELTKVEGQAVLIDGVLTKGDVSKILAALEEDPERSIDLSDLFVLGRRDGRAAFEQIGQWALKKKEIEAVKVFVPRTSPSVLADIEGVPGLEVYSLG